MQVSCLSVSNEILGQYLKSYLCSPESIVNTVLEKCIKIPRNTCTIIIRHLLMTSAWLLAAAMLHISKTADVNNTIAPSRQGSV